MRRTFLCYVLPLLLLAPSLGRAQSPAPVTPDSGLLRPGDVVQLSIWREPDLSGEFTVDAGGIVVLPKIGRLNVIGVPPAELRERILGEYARYLRNPSIQVTFLRRVNVLGAVREPGLYPVDPTMTIADVLALAGGTAPEGRTDRLRLYREGRRIETRISEGTRVADTPIRSGDHLYVPQQGWLSRNSGVVAAMVSGAVSLIFAVIIANGS